VTSKLAPICTVLVGLSMSICTTLASLPVLKTLGVGGIPGLRVHRHTEAELPEFCRGDYSGGELEAALLIVQRLTCLSLNSDDASGPRNLKLEVRVTGHGHELDLAGLPQDHVVRSDESNQFKHEHLRAVVACIPEVDQLGHPSKVDRVLARDHSTEWVWAALELVRGKPQSLKRVEVHEIEATAPVLKGLGEPGCPD
jgi:hypothetical protein